MRTTLYTRLELAADFRGLDDELADPTTATLAILSTSGVRTAPEVSRDGVGLYSASFVPDASGTWFARWKGSGSVQASSPDIPIYVAETRFPNAPAPDPSTLLLTGWWRASYSGVPWVGTESAGPSASRPLVALASFDPPVAGTPENGFTPASWTTIDQAFDTGLPVGSFVSASAWSFSALVYVDGTLAVGFESLIASDNDQYWGVGILNAADHSGFVVDIFQWIGDEDQYVDLIIPVPVNQWVEIQATYDGTNISGRVNNGAWTSIAAPTIVDLDLATNLLIGAPILTTFNGSKMLDMKISSVAFPTSTFDDIIRTHDRNRYGLDV